jgi:hypothetical protein
MRGERCACACARQKYEKAGKKDHARIFFKKIPLDFYRVLGRFSAGSSTASQKYTSKTFYKTNPKPFVARFFSAWGVINRHKKAFGTKNELLLGLWTPIQKKVRTYAPPPFDAPRLKAGNSAQATGCALGGGGDLAALCLYT